MPQQLNKTQSMFGKLFNHLTDIRVIVVDKALQNGRC